MTEPEASSEDVQEQQLSVIEEPELTDDELPSEAPEADVAEQRAEIVLDEEDDR